MGCYSSREPIDFEGPVDFGHFEILRAIGKGAFGKVCIVKKKDTRQMYAMKYMNKLQIIEKRAVDNVFREIHILKALDHPFLVNVWFAFQDEEDIFLVIDLMLGGDISYHLEKEGRFTVPRVRLYLAEICLALDYLRDKRIIHRDIKPANMLLDSKGHVHLTDFNVACIHREGKVITSMTGTKPYMAPEVIRPTSRGYLYAVDWWSLGVSAYEMLRGERPYNIHHNMTSSDIYSMLTRVRPPASARWDEPTCNILKILLHPDPNKRLSTLVQAKSHSFFKELDWEQVLHTETAPSYIPSQNRIHCDPTHELEEMIVEPNPLHKKKARLSKRRQKDNEVGEMYDTLTKISDRFTAYNRIRESLARVESHDEENIIAETVSNSPLSTMDVSFETGNLRDTSLSLLREPISTSDILQDKKETETKKSDISPEEVLVQLHTKNDKVDIPSKITEEINKPDDEKPVENSVEKPQRDPKVNPSFELSNEEPVANSIHELKKDSEMKTTDTEHKQANSLKKDGSSHKTDIHVDKGHNIREEVSVFVIDENGKSSAIVSNNVSDDSESRTLLSL